ncbi:MAG: crossover junction endodeoxyribonuclease RuvC [Phycisphaeraceae bacterium]|nr:MAG: crossover junction endodeoxyribonuclease RuvC [Phycisphaeraceae bacterium]
MRVLGIDPGLRLTGYGCVEGDERSPRIVEAGVFRLTQGSGSPPPIADRLDELERDLAELIARVRPDAAAVEALFAHYKHPATAMVMAHARGVILLTLKRAGLPFAELAPKTVKQAMTGSGRAAKRQMQEAVASVFGLPAPPEPPDVADALAIAFAAMIRAGGDIVSA